MLSTITKRWTSASVLCEMPHQEGYEGCQKHHYEKWQASDSGCVPDMRHEDV